MPQPSGPPIGQHLARVSKVVGRAFDDALRDAGGSMPSWLILLALKTRDTDTQAALAEVVGIRGATLTHHLDGMEAAGLVGRERDPANRRVQRVRMTAAGEQAFLRMRDAAIAFDRRLRRGISADEAQAFGRVLDRMTDNVSP